MIRNQDRNSLLAYRAGVANTSELRRRGLLKHERLEDGEGLWIVPCEAVHTFGMKFSIDVLYLSKSKRVLKVRQAIPRSRMSFCLRAHSVLELPAGTVAATGTAAGDQLAFERVAI